MPPCRRNLSRMNPRPTDPLGRTVDYLRISITDRCNERCLYCLPENYSDWLPRGETLSYDELHAIVRAAISIGFKRFRVTGGEPLLRAGVVEFIRELVNTPDVEPVQLINVSLDAIDPAIYRAITKGEVEPVLRGIRLARELGFESVKLNTVLMRGRNEGEISPLLDFAAQHDIVIRFIELMPVSLTAMLDATNFLPVTELLARLRRDDELEPLDATFGFGPAKYYRLNRRGVTVGLIGALSDLHFCERCNKMRLTCDGNLRPCLGNHLETYLKPALRPRINEDQLRRLICGALAQKPAEHLFLGNYQPHRVMTAIGG
jgi:cyclic pyranopterin phosphate synthase